MSKPRRDRKPLLLRDALPPPPPIFTAPKGIERQITDLLAFPTPPSS